MKKSKMRTNYGGLGKSIHDQSPSAISAHVTETGRMLEKLICCCEGQGGEIVIQVPADLSGAEFEILLKWIEFQKFAASQ